MPGVTTWWSHLDSQGSFHSVATGSEKLFDFILGHLDCVSVLYHDPADGVGRVGIAERDFVHVAAAQPVEGMSQLSRQDSRHDETTLLAGISAALQTQLGHNLQLICIVLQSLLKAVELVHNIQREPDLFL